MISKKIYYWWIPEYKKFSPSGREPGENIRRTPKQGYGVCEIAAWLSSDIQYAPHSVDIWIKNLTDLASGKSTDGNFGIGNAHWILVSQGHVFIGCEYVEEQQVLLTIEQVLYVLEQYRNFLEGYHATPDFPPEPIDVEYVAEGKEAIARYESLEGAYCLPY